MMTRLLLVVVASIGLLAAAGCEKKVTVETYDSIATGMTQSQVEEMLGGAGEEQEVGGVSIGADGLMSTKGGGGKDKTFVWKSGDGGQITVTFRDGKVIDKGKAGL